MIIPDYTSCLTGHRVWNWDAAGLTSLNGERWVAQQPLSAVCRADAIGSIAGLSKATHNAAELPYLKCTCGVYAAKTIEHLRQCGYKNFEVRGEVYLWGTVVEHERGWRAQFFAGSSDTSCARTSGSTETRKSTTAIKPYQR